MSHNTDLSKLARLLDTGTNGQVLTSQGGNAFSFADATGGGGGGSSTSALSEQEFTATANQTVFTVSGGITNANNVSVFLNGSMLGNADVTVSSSANTATLQSGAAVGDLVTVAEYGQPSGLALGTTSTTALAGNTSIPDGTFASLTGKPTTLAGYGITDGASAEISTLSLVQNGALSITTGTARQYVPYGLTITKVVARTITAPVGSALNVTVKKNGNSWNTIAIAAGASKATNASLSLALVEDDYLTVDINQVGSSSSGSDLTVTLYYTKG